MYTRCPECRTIFRLGKPQLEARSGVVRCGRCQSVFRGDQHLVEKPLTEPVEADAGMPSDTRPNPPARRRHRGGATADRYRTEEAERAAARAALDTVAKGDEALLFGRRNSRARALLWAIGDALLLVVLVGQLMFYFRGELAERPNLRPLVVEFCRLLGCEIHARRDIGLVDLTETTIAPLQEQGNALRIRTAMVNRAGFAQPFPLMEVTLTDSAGNVLARRTFTPQQYLGKRRTVEEKMPPNVLIDTSLDVTNPEGKAVGYEVRLVSP